MAEGRWNHTAHVLTSIENLSRLVGMVFGSKTKFVKVTDMHPYLVEPEPSKLDKAFASRMLEISRKVPIKDRPEARRKLMEEYQAEGGKV